MAGRIPQQFLDDLLDRIDIVEVIDRRVKLKKTGKNYSARCPFHEEKTPSFTVNPDKQFYYCFGCGAGGNALGFVMDYENIDFPRAVDVLAGSLGLEVPREQSGPGAPPPRREEAYKPLYAILEEAATFYRRQLREHAGAPRAVDYLKSRGLTGEIAKQFDLGFAPPGWDNLLQALGGDERQRKLLLDAGLLVENDAGRTYDRFRDRVIFPIRDQRGRIIAFGGRVLGDDKPKYLNSPETPVFAKGRELYGLYQARQANRRLERVVVVEGYMDVIALAQHGITCATATLGTATSPIHLERLFRQTSEVVFCFDGDDAGRKAALRALESTLPSMQDGRQARFLFLPEGEDPDTLVRQQGPEHFQQLMREAAPLERFLFEAAGEGLDTATMEGRARLSKQALPYLRQLPDGVFRQLMFRALAERTGLSVAELMQIETPPLRRPPEPAPERPDSPAPPVAGPAATDRAAHPRQRHASQAARLGHSNLTQSAIALLLHRPDIARLADPGPLEHFEGEDISLLRELLQLLQRRPESNTAMLLGHWYGTPQGELLNRLAGLERLIPHEGIEQQFLDTMAALEQLPERSKLRDQVDKLRTTNYAELSDADKQRIRELIRHKQRLDEARKKGR
jgi:DNA primase